MNQTISIRSPESRSLRAYMLAWLVMALGLASCTLHTGVDPPDPPPWGVPISGGGDLCRG